MINNMKLHLWSRRVVIFLNVALILGYGLGFISEGLMKETFPFALLLNFIYALFPAYGLYKLCYGNKNIEDSIKKTVNKTTKENDYDK
ncbi:TPA: hypothetical protein ACH271_005506 [Klebsiella pneumoniae]|nr:hypothetical protein [Klebsiella pneumoniae]